MLDTSIDVAYHMTDGPFSTRVELKEGTHMLRGKDNVRGALALIGAGAIAIAMAIFGLAVSSNGVHAQTPGATYAGDVEVLTANQCGGGTITLTLDATGANIVEIVLDGTYVGGVLVNSVATPPGGPLVITPAPPIAIAGDGTFDTTFQPITGVDADFAGTFDTDTVDGTFGVPALQCVDVPFSAVAGATLPTATATVEAPTAEATATVAATVAATALPETGAGTTSTGSGDGATLWISLGIIGIVSIAGGALILNRRRA
jgi:hypothetical protein